jgi:fluoroacetyl-CoA thioesterase
MKVDLRHGISRVDRITVDKDRTISFMGDGASVYSTPRLVQDIEQTCRNLLLDYSDVGEDSVGMEISLQHLAPTLVGMVVEITVTVKGVDGRKVSFEVHAKDDFDVIGVGSHTRFVVDVARTLERLKAKAARRVPSG